MSNDKFQLTSDFSPAGDQNHAIRELVTGFLKGQDEQVLLGATGTGKTFTMANVIQDLNKPTLILCHNKTLAAQLFGEFKQFFPNNSVEFFISFYDYYQPEAYMPSSDTYIEKDSSINDEIDRLRLKATSALLERRDVIVVASVSSIYGLGSPETYKAAMRLVTLGEEINRKKFFRELIDMLYTRNDIDFQRGTFRVRGDVIEIFPAYDINAIRLSFFCDELEEIDVVNPLTGEIISKRTQAAIFPAKHFISTDELIRSSIKSIRREMNQQIAYFKQENKFIEAQRIEQRTNYDMEMLQEIGYCSGIENYSRYLDGRKKGERPFCLFDFFPNDYLLMIDESHQSVPQVRGMHAGDRARKETLINYGFRLPSALDNRPLQFDEFESLQNQVLYISATPSDYELKRTKGIITEQIIRPTGLVDPIVEIRPIKTQVDDLIDEIRKIVIKKERILVTTLTKRMSEDLSDYLSDLDIRVKYLHSEIDALERVELLKNLRLGNFDVLVGINLLREGLDLPEVSLVAILDADKEGFLRSRVSLLQTIGRAARNINGRVIMYADKITNSMQIAISETNRRRKKQIQYNEENNITAKTIIKTREQIEKSASIIDLISKEKKNRVAEANDNYLPDELYTIKNPSEKITFLNKKMREAAEELSFERAAKLRDEMNQIKNEFNL